MISLMREGNRAGSRSGIGRNTTLGSKEEEGLEKRGSLHALDSHYKDKMHSSLRNALIDAQRHTCPHLD